MTIFGHRSGYQGVHGIAKISVYVKSVIWCSWNPKGFNVVHTYVHDTRYHNTRDCSPAKVLDPQACVGYSVVRYHEGCGLLTNLTCK